MKIPKLFEDWGDIPFIEESTLTGNQMCTHPIEDEFLKRACDLIIMEASYLKRNIPDISSLDNKYKEELLRLLVSVFKPLNVQAEILGEGEIISIEDFIVKDEDMMDIPENTEDCTRGGYLIDDYDEHGNYVPYHDALISLNLYSFSKFSENPITTPENLNEAEKEES